MHIQAFRIAEEISLPVMVCMDGFILTHAYDEVDIPDQEKVDAFLPPFEPRQLLDPADPMTIGAMVGPEAFFEVKYLAHHKQMQALDVIPEVAQRLRGRLRATLRRPGAPLPNRGRRDDHRRARLRARDDRGSRRRDARRRHQGGRARHQVLPAVPAGGGSRSALGGLPRSGSREGPGRRPRWDRLHQTSTRRWSAATRVCSTVIAGLGGRAITRESLQQASRAGRARRARAAQLPRPRHRIGPARAGPRARRPARWPARREHAPRPRRGRGGGPLRTNHALPGRQALPDGHLSRSGVGCSIPRSARCRRGRSAPTR